MGAEGWGICVPVEECLSKSQFSDVLFFSSENLSPRKVLCVLNMKTILG